MHKRNYPCCLHIFSHHCKDPLHWFNNLYSNYSSRFYWETPARSSTIAALGTIRQLSFDGPDRFKTLEDTFEEANSEIRSFSSTGIDENPPPRWVGGFSFYPHIKSTIWNGFHPAHFSLPELAVFKEARQAMACISIYLGKGISAEELHYEITQRLLLFSTETLRNGESAVHKIDEPTSFRELDGNKQGGLQRWTDAINEAKKQFHSTDLKKVVLSRMNQLSFDNPCRPVHTLFNLRRQYPGGCSFLIKNEHSATFVGCSPELLISADNRSIETEALAGSIDRGKDDDEDELLASRLFASSKDQQEHAYVVQSIKEALSPFLANMTFSEQPTIKKLPNVQHLYTPIRGKIAESTTILNLLESLHPTPAVGGTPRSTSLRFIREQECFERGWFAAPVGWITGSGDACFYVAIRSGLIKQNRAFLFAGCGIVADSEPKAEWEEANLKFKPMLSALSNE